MVLKALLKGGADFWVFFVAVGAERADAALAEAADIVWIFWLVFERPWSPRRRRSATPTASAVAANSC